MNVKSVSISVNVFHLDFLFLILTMKNPDVFDVSGVNIRASGMTLDLTVGYTPEPGTSSTQAHVYSFNNQFTIS